MKSQRADVEHVIECIRGIAEDPEPGREAVLTSRTLQDANRSRRSDTLRVDPADRGAAQTAAPRDHLGIDSRHAKRPGARAELDQSR